MELIMSDKAFSYPEFEKVRTELITTIQQSFTDTDKEFLISIKSLEPKWDIYTMVTLVIPTNGMSPY